MELSVDRVLERVLAEIEDHRLAWVTGDVGSGRATLARQLRDHLAGDGGRAAWIDMLELPEADAVIGGLFSAAGWLPDANARRSCFQDWSSMQVGAKTFAKKAGRDFTLILTLPPSWSGVAPAECDAYRHAIAERARAFLHGLSRIDVRVVLITARSMQPSALGNDELVPIGLSAPRNAQALLVTQPWGPYQEPAEELRQQLPKDFDPSPVLLRLAVGAVGLGASAASVAHDLQESKSTALRLLVDELHGRLSLPAHEDVRRAVVRQLLARRPLPRKGMGESTGVPEKHLPLLTDCLGYGSEQVRVSSNVRRLLAERLLLPRSKPDEEFLVSSHEMLAKHYSVLDGASQITDTKGFATTAWLEKMHHLAYVRPDQTLDLPCRELYWKRARELSIQRKDYAAAAKMYEACTSRFPDDAYSWHYLGFNLEHAGVRRVDAETAYRNAVERDPANPWWNSRLVTFLIGQGRPRAARTAWNEAVDRVDPDAERISDTPWLTEHFHQWVCRAWLEAGSASDAFEILQSVPEEIIEYSRSLCALKQRVLDAVESEALGGSVYPASYPILNRWTRPGDLPDNFEGNSLREWFPGRIISTGSHVHVFYGAKNDNEYRSMVTSIPNDDWMSISRCPDARTDDFVVLGLYADGSRVVVAQPRGERERLPNDLPLAYFDRWRSRK